MQLNASSTELVTAVTNLPLAITSLMAVGSLLHRRQEQPLRAWVWIGMFGTLAIATGVGIFAHGLALDSTARKLLWHPINAALGLTVAAFVAGAVLDGWGLGAARHALPVLLLLAAGFLAYRNLYPENFLPFIVYESVAMLFCLGVYLMLIVQHRVPGAGWMVAGIGITILAAVLQATPLTVRFGVTFDHNGVFHLVQLPGLFCLLAGVQKGLGPSREKVSDAARMFPPLDPIQMNDLPPTVETLLAAAMEYAGAAERHAFLEKACAGHPALRQEAESLLSASEQAGNFMSAQSVTAAETAIGRERRRCDPFESGAGLSRAAVRSTCGAQEKQSLCQSTEWS